MGIIPVQHENKCINLINTKELILALGLIKGGEDGFNFLQGTMYLIVNFHSFST